MWCRSCVFDTTKNSLSPSRGEGQGKGEFQRQGGVRAASLTPEAAAAAYLSQISGSMTFMSLYSIR